MDKRAQKRGLIDKLKENVNLGGRAAEIFSPTFAAIMDKLRDTDDKVREALNSDSNLKDLLKDSRSDFNRREYMSSIAKLKKFHDIFEKVHVILQDFHMDVTKAHEEFIFEGLDEETKQSLTGLKSKFETKSSLKNLLIKDAGISDWWYTLTNDRGKALRAWEKRYPSQMKKLKSQTDSLISKSENLLKLLLVSLEEMSSARSGRKLEAYSKAVEKFLSKYKDYNNQFKQYYIENIKNFVEKVQLTESKSIEVKDKESNQEIKVNDKGSNQENDLKPKGDPILELVNEHNKVSKTPEDIAKQENLREQLAEQAKKDQDKTNQAPPSSNTDQSETNKAPPSSKTEKNKQAQIDAIKAKIDPIYEDILNVNIDIKSYEEQLNNQDNLDERDKVKKFLFDAVEKKEALTKQFKQLAAELKKLEEESKPKSAHNNLLNTLKVLSSESPKVLAREIYKYAKSIENTDLNTSLKLLAIVEGIIE